MTQKSSRQFTRFTRRMQNSARPLPTVGPSRRTYPSVNIYETTSTIAILPSRRG